MPPNETNCAMPNNAGNTKLKIRIRINVMTVPTMININCVLSVPTTLNIFLNNKKIPLNISPTTNKPNKGMAGPFPTLDTCPLE